jgi:hypothetical protein
MSLPTVWTLNGRSCGQETISEGFIVIAVVVGIATGRRLNLGWTRSSKMSSLFTERSVAFRSCYTPRSLRQSYLGDGFIISDQCESYEIGADLDRRIQIESR